MMRAELRREPLAPESQLAVALSVATRIEAELVRAVRLAVLPHLDVGAESDFWFSAWVGARQPQVVALRPDLLDLLRDRLTSVFTPVALERLRSVITRLHHNLSPALALEEDVTWHACTGGPEGVEKACALLRRASKAIAVELRDGVAGWVVDAMTRLPEEVLQSTDGWHLVLNARRLRSDDITAEPANVGDPRVIEDILIPVAHGTKDTTMRRCIGVRWQNGKLVVGEGSEGAVTIRLPHHVPPLVELLEHGSTTASWHSVEQTLVHQPRQQGPIRLRTLDGRVFEIPDAVGDSVHASPVLVEVEGALGDPARFWLQPVRFANDTRARNGQPVALLMKVLDTIPVDPNALARLHRWLDQEAVCAVRLLHGWTEEQRVRLATQIATEGERAGWHVFRGRQDPAAATWLRSDKPVPGTRGILLVVDHADSWHPQHLRGMLAALLDGSAPTRVLLLSVNAGPWWQALTRSLADSSVDWAVQQLSAERPPRRGNELFARAVDVVAETISVDLTAVKVSRGAFTWLLEDDVELVAVAAALETMSRKATKAHAAAAKVVLRYEHLYRVRKEPELCAQVAALTFLATLLRPLHLGHARELCIHFGLIEPDGWRPLLAAYERLYALDQEALDPLGGCQLADELLAGVLLDRDDGLGVDPDWAHRIVSSIASFPVEARDAAPRVMYALAHAATRFTQIATCYLYPLIADHPELLIAAGTPAITTVIRIQHAPTELLQLISDALPEPQHRDVHLDPAVAELETALVSHLLGQGRPGPDRDAPLHLRLSRSQARAGLTERALTSAQQASREYRRLVASEPRVHTSALCESLILESELLGELGLQSQALKAAEDAERQLRRHQLRMMDRPGANLGSALANLGRQRARAGNAPTALADVTQAVGILRGLARAQSAEYLPELAEALVNQSDRAAEAGDSTLALSAARQALELTAQLTATNYWAHVHRHAAAHRCLAARMISDEDALPYTTEAVALYRQAAQASPERFELPLAAALVQHAQVARKLGREDALVAVEEAIGTYERRAQTGHADDLAFALTLRDRWEGGSA